ncbi:PLAC8 family protein [Colletotrichum nymphaeae SA-01]|uniref:PLAC8 family protein n=1 Tax=Colletotrichum nymphaeae SA-01 TaxID=1460502 RepID=A0A135SS56_9PEZI|nr:PLAC8 family protein [Colletotrichum nymphaeae SA-01]
MDYSQQPKAEYHQPQMQPQMQPQQQQQQYYEQQQPQQQQLQHQPHPQHQQTMQQEYVQGANVQTQEWQSSLMDCGPCDTCIVGTCLPCLLLGKTSERMRDPTMQTYEAINTDCLLMCGITWFTGCGWIYAMMKRGEIRERFGIKGSGGSDCCVSYWCGCCALIQQDKEVQARLSTGPIVQGYQPQKEGMHMPPQQA